MVFATCSSVSSSGIGSSCNINIAFNKQLPLCASTTDSGLRNGKRVCRPPEQLCTADPDFNFDFTESNGNDVGGSQPLTAMLRTEPSVLGILEHTSRRYFPGELAVAPRPGHIAEPSYTGPPQARRRQPRRVPRHPRHCHDWNGILCGKDASTGLIRTMWCWRCRLRAHWEGSQRLQSGQEGYRSAEGHP